MKSSNLKSDSCDLQCGSCTEHHNPMLRGQDLITLSGLDSHKSEISFGRGEYVFKQGAYPSGLFCLSRGKVLISKVDKNGNSIIINLHREVSFLGISDYVAGHSYQSNCLCVSDVKVCMIQEDQIRMLLKNNWTFAQKVLKTIAMDYHQSNMRMLAITKKNMSARLAGALLELIEVFGMLKSGEINVYMKRSELAILSCMSTANVIRHLSLFQKSGFIIIAGKQIKIINQDALTHESEIS